MYPVMTALILSGLMFSAAISAQTFEVIDTGAPDGGSSAAMAIAEENTVVGWFDSAGHRTPFIKCEDCALSSLGFLPFGDSAAATAISNNGEFVAGYSEISFSELGAQVPQAFIWTASDGMSGLGALYNPAMPSRRHGYSEAQGVNDLGQAVGFSVIFRANAIHAFLWEAGTMRDIGGGPASTSISRAFDINNSTQIIGDFAQGTEAPVTWGHRRAFLWQDDIRHDLGTLPGHTSSSARAINEHSQIAGWSGLSESELSDVLWSHAVLWENGMIQDLGTLPGDESSQALAINDYGQIAGWSGNIEQGVYRAFLWRCNEMIDLNTLIPADAGWKLIEARGINNKGYIVGVGLKEGQLRAYTLKPVLAGPGRSHDKASLQGQQRSHPRAKSRCHLPATP